jgi:hypothetical protein
MTITVHEGYRSDENHPAVSMRDKGLIESIRGYLEPFINDEICVVGIEEDGTTYSIKGKLKRVGFRKYFEKSNSNVAYVFLDTPNYQIELPFGSMEGENEVLVARVTLLSHRAAIDPQSAIARGRKPEELEFTLQNELLFYNVPVAQRFDNLHPCFSLDR